MLWDAVRQLAGQEMLINAEKTFYLFFNWVLNFTLMLHRGCAVAKEMAELLQS